MLLAALLVVHTPADITFVRHGETLANATGKYNASTIDTFSPKGEKQVSALTKRLLAGQPYYAIYVSPSPRAMKTILPYLKARRQTAVIWPLLYECCTGRRPANAHATKFTWGSKIVVPEAMKSYFTRMPSWTRYPVAPGYNEGLAQVAAEVKQFGPLARGRVLFVGHSGNGGQLIKALTGKSMRVENAREIPVTLR